MLELKLIQFSKKEAPGDVLHYDQSNDMKCSIDEKKTQIANYIESML